MPKYVNLWPGLNSKGILLLKNVCFYGGLTLTTVLSQVESTGLSRVQRLQQKDQELSQTQVSTPQNQVMSKIKDKLSPSWT